MMLLDGCFLLQFLLPDVMKVGMPELPVMKTMWFDSFLRTDLLMLENQLPFFIVERLFDALGAAQFKGNILQSAASFALPNIPSISDVSQLDPTGLQNLHIHHLLYFSHALLSKIPVKDNKSAADCCKLLDYVKRLKDSLLQRVDQNHHSRITDSITSCCSLLDHIKKSMNKLMPPPQQWRQSKSSDQSSVHSKRTACATQLVEAGVKLKSTSEKIFLDISFAKGVLEIPTIVVDDRTNSTFRNLIALEQSCPQFGQIFADYFIFMDAIINSPKDVALLEEEGIIVHWPGDHEEVASLFNRLGRNVFYYTEKDYLADVILKVNQYCESRWHKWRARLVRDYFGNPWAIISVLAAVVVLGVTIAQTIYSILSYYNRK